MLSGDIWTFQPGGPTIFEAFRWSAATGYQMLGIPTGYQASFGNDVSDDGSALVGTVRQPSDADRAFVWRENTGMVLLDLLPNATLPEGIAYTYANKFSGNGRVIVGASSVETDDAMAVRWVDGVISPLGTLPGDLGSSVATGVTPDGSVIVGQANHSAGYRSFSVDRVRRNAKPLADG